MHNENSSAIHLVKYIVLDWLTTCTPGYCFISHVAAPMQHLAAQASAGPCHRKHGCLRLDHSHQVNLIVVPLPEDCHSMCCQLLCRQGSQSYDQMTLLAGSQP